MPAEDWMSISVRRRTDSASMTESLETLAGQEVAAELIRLRRESDRSRRLATGATGAGTLSYEEWAEFAEDMRQKLAAVDVTAAADAREELPPIPPALNF